MPMSKRARGTNNRRQFLKNTSIISLGALSPAILAGCDIGVSKEDAPNVPPEVLIFEGKNSFLKIQHTAKWLAYEYRIPLEAKAQD